MTDPFQQQLWLETRWHVPANRQDDLPPLFEQMGSLGSFVNMDLDAEKEAAKTHVEMVSYFPDRKDPEPFVEHLIPIAKPLDAEFISVNRLPYGDWATAWKEFFKPFALTKHLVVRPSWEEYTAKKDELILTLDPGMAFGTGQHDTTRFCSELLEELSDRDDKLASVLDVGCGSGILSLAAAALGYKNIIGIDNDPAAIETALENRDRNDFASDVVFKHTDGALDPNAYPTNDVVVANIIAEALAELAPELKACARPGGYLILSGILPTRADIVLDAFKDLALIDQKISKDWHAYLYRRSK